MVLRPTVVPVLPQNAQQPKKKPISKPYLLNLRSSKQFIFWTAAVGLFTSTFVHSILFPLSPFIVNRIKHNNVDDDSYHSASALASDSEVTSRETGILVALYAVGLLCGSPLFGWLGDKIKQRRLPMLLGIAASMAANYVFMFSIAYWMLLLARFLQGVANACVWTMSLCLIADNWPIEQYGLQMGKLVGFYPLGLLVGLPLGGILYSNLGYQSPFIASSILTGLDFLMRLVIIEPCHSPPECAFEPTLSMRFASEWNFDAADCGLILIAFMVPSVISSAVCGWLCDKYGCKIVAFVSLILTIPAGVLMGIPEHHTTFWVFVPILAFCGITMAGCQAPVFPEIARVVELENHHKKNDKDGLAKSYALFNAAYGTGMCVGPIVAGFLYSSVGFFWLCCILSTIFLVCIPVVYLYTGGSRQWIVRQPPKVEES
ncbi:major facilitator superfamily domain-containing protein [Halteromyces radiatus]|uniref:major facilitator superfamily domain-containing protein n=1 Tax=Halteromyces radiatus TaxID=101107 RepID=UPI00221E602B|nr:major facilitator superfamily domain-containing protein [Halteromyces radiatus]KAI8096323.1 major facilitator superfamily domain-containing protein [Halteromyces radiatus]